jgi:hypothetical protein
MKKIALALTLIITVTLLISASAAAYYFSVNESYQAENSLPAAPPAPDTSSSPTNTSTPSPTSTPAPAPTATPTPTQTPHPTEIHVSKWNPPSDAYATTVIIDSPMNNTAYSTNNVTLSVHAGTRSKYYIFNLYLEADWLEKGRQLFYHLSTDNGHSFPFFMTKGISVTLTLIGIPEGHHSLTVIANTNSESNGSSSVSFSINIAPP